MKSYNTVNPLGYVIRVVHCSECLCNKEEYPKSVYKECERKSHYKGCYGGVPTKEISKKLKEMEYVNG